MLVRCAEVKVTRWLERCLCVVPGCLHQGTELSGIEDGERGQIRSTVMQETKQARGNKARQKFR